MVYWLHFNLPFGGTPGMHNLCLWPLDMYPFLTSPNTCVRHIMKVSRKGQITYTWVCGYMQHVDVCIMSNRLCPKGVKLSKISCFYMVEKRILFRRCLYTVTDFFFQKSTERSNNHIVESDRRWKVQWQKRKSHLCSKSPIRNRSFVINQDRATYRHRLWF